MQLGELLIMSGVITQEQLNEAIAKQKLSKKKLGEILLETGALTEKQLIEAMEFQLGIPSINLADTQIEYQAVQTVSESIARKHQLIPISISGGKIRIAIVDPLNYDAIEEVRLSSGLNVQPLIGIKSEINEAISRHYRIEDTMEEMIEEFELPEVVNDEEEANNQSSPIVKLVSQMIQSAVLVRASDIHVDPQEKQVVIRYRVDGHLRTEKLVPKQMQGVLTARIKIVANLNIAERRLPQDGRIQMQVDRRRIDIRVSTLPTVHGESIVLRILDQSGGVSQISNLGLSELNEQRFRRVIAKPNGIILISGPTGSGKTSTLYSALGSLNQPDVKIVTVEDPVEYRMDGITQVQVNSQIGLTFASGLRSILRQDPNIVMVGEIRDMETAEIAVRASLTGHMVLSTIHTNSAASTISRLIDMNIDPYLIASSLVCVVGQRLVRRVCAECAEKVAAQENEYRLFEEHGLLAAFGKNSGLQSAVGATFTSSSQSTLYLVKGRGCSTCNKTGYKGRMAIHEVLAIDEPLRRLIVQNRPIDEILQNVTERGYRTMLYDGLIKAQQGMTTIEEVLKAVSDD
ncbi:GspE/PulE family protein [Paenibacillus dokdonensis]|uniref:GspE/PulE family protein n=1 Tax=Paenibacillus dokdonensis TaxID=2567944 RepID=UPI0010A75E7B|nr:ATPase, T2SS/T4P/T4SS family [Paenibacillus dokdonensis]